MAERLEDRRLLAVVNWDGGGGDLNWNNPANWDTDQLPGAGDDVMIADIAPDIAIFHSSGNTSINSLVSDEALVISGGTLDIAAASSINDNLTLGTSSSAYLTGAGDVTVGGLFTWTGGRLQGTGTLIASGGMQIEGGSSKYLERIVNNAGTASWAGGRIQATADGVFNNLAGATFDALTNNQMNGSFNNAGTFIRSTGTSFATFTNAFDNTGSVQVQSGILNFSGSGDSSGSFQVDTGGTLRIQGGTHVLDANATLTGAGKLSIINNTTLNVASDISIGSLDVLSTSSSFTPILTGSGDVRVGGLFEWTGGRLQGTGKLIANGGMQINGRYDKYLERTLDNAAIANWTDGLIRTSPTGVFNNLAGAKFDAKSDDSFIGSTATFNNAGTLVKSAGTGSSSFSTGMNNSGAVQVQSGTLNFSGGGSSSGSFQVDVDSTLQISSGTHVFNDGWNVTGAGNLLISGGTLGVAHNGNVENLSLGSSSSAILTGAGNVTVDGLFTWTGGRLQGTGTLIASGGMQIEGGSSKYLERIVNNAGTASWAGGRIQATADGVFNNLAGATFDALTNNQMNGSFNNAGTFIRSTGTSFATFTNAFDNTGSVQVQSGTLYFPGGGFTQTAGETLLDGGNLNSTTPFEFQGGGLAGFGVVIGDVVMGGLLEPNSSTDNFGSIQITGDYIQSPTLDAGGPYSVDEEGSVQLDATLSATNGALKIEIGGIATYDQIDVDDNLTLTGPLNVILSGGYEPLVGDTFTIVNNAGSDAITGVFAGLPEGATFTVGNTQFQISYSGGTDSNDVVLTAVDPTNPDQGGDTVAFHWDLDGDGNFGETGVAAERGDELGASVSFSAEGLEGPATFPVGVRAAFNSGAFSAVSATTVELSDSPADPLPDLLVSSTNISFSPANPSPGESVTILATIENVGQIDASDILVDVYESETLLQQITIPSLAVGATQDVSVTTSFADLGPRSITARIDPLDSIMELNEDNNEATKTLHVSDSTPPATSVTRTVDANAAGWNNTDVGLTLSSIDEVSGSGISQITYSINGGAPVTQPGDTVDLSFTQEGICAVAFYAVDVALNAETQQSVQVKIDKTAPTPVFSGPFAVDEGSSALPDGSASSDLLSGVGSLQWAIGDGEFEPENTPIFSSLDGPSTQDVVLRVTDLAGNEATITSQAMVNNVAPTATISTAGTFTYGQSATVSLTDSADPSPADTAAGFSYSFGLSTDELASTYSEADSSTSARSVTFTEDDFAPSAWSTSVLLGPAGGQTSLQIADGGNSGTAPDPYFAVSTNTNSGVHSVHLSSENSYDPSAGAIASIDFSIDYRNISFFGQGQGFRPAIEQAGDFYHLTQGQISGPGGSSWSTFEVLGLTPSDFVRVDGSPGIPDFSSTGAPVTFGFATANSSGNTIQVGYDNWTVSVNTAADPSSWATQLDIGTHTVYGRIFDKDDGFTDYETTVTVEQATLTVTADDITTPYSGAAFSDFTVSYAGFVGGDDENALEGSLAFSGSAVGAIEVGDYTINAAGLTSDNYFIDFASGQLTIEKADANIVVSGQTITYDGTEYSATGSATGVDNQPLAGLDLGSGFIDAPGGTANWSFTDATGNYNDASGSVAINIAKAVQTINWATPGSIVQGTPLSASQLNATVSVVGPALAGELQYAPDFGTVLGIGENELTVTAAETANYRQANASVFLTVEDPNVAPAIVLASSSTSAVRDAQFFFDGSFTDPDADNWTATVNYGDGSGEQPLALNGKNFQLAHTYDTEGPFVIVITVDDGKGGVDSKNLTVVVQPPPRADVTLISADVLFNPINPSVGDPVNFEIDVSNDGNIAANNVTVSVQVFDGAGEAFQEIGRTVIGSIPGNSEAPVTLTWNGTDQPALPSEDTYLLVRVVLDPDNTIQEESESNNEAIQVLQIGSPDFGTAALTATVNPFTTTRGTYTPVGGQAYYNFSTIPGANDFPVQNASVTARLIDPATGEVLRVSGAQTAPNGNFLHFFRAPEVDGTYTLQYEVNEGTLSAVFESTLTVAGEPTETPPRARGPGGPGYVFSASVVPPESLEIGVPATILGSFNYDLDDELDVDVTFNNLFPVAGKLQTFEIGSSEITFPEGGIDEPLIEPMEWIPTAEGYHILQVIAEPSVPLRAHLRATQLVLVGDLDTTSLNVEYDAVVTGSGGSGGEGEADGSGVQAPSPGDRLLFALTYENTGTTTITGGFLMDNFDETLVGIPFNVSDGGIVDGNSVRWELGDIEPGETGFVTYEVIINSEAEFPAGSSYLLNTAILNADQSATATTSEIVISNNAPVISGLEVNPFVDENGGVTLAGTFSDASIEDTHEVSITWGDGTSDTLAFSQGERSFSIEHTYDLDGLTGLQSFPIAVSVTDGSDQSASGSVTTQAELGAPPVANAGGPYTITVGESLTLDASESADPDGDPLSFAWDLTGNAEYTDSTDASPALSWQSLVALGIDAAGEYEVAVQVTGGTDSDIATTTLNVLYATPTITIDWTGGVYSGTAFAATGSVIGFDDSLIGSPTFAYYVGGDTNGNSLPTAPIAAGNYTVEATFAGDSLHASAAAVSSIVIDRANALIMVDGATATYDGTAYGATGSATGVSGEPLAGLDFGTSFTNAPGGAATWMFTDATGNYIDASGSVEINILKATQTINWNTPESIEQGTPLSETQLNATVSVVGPSPAGALSYTPSVGTVLDVGFHTLTVNAAETLNYLPATASVNITVSGATIIDDSLLIIGTNTDDHILLTQIGSWHLVTADFLPGWLHTKSFRRGDYDQIEVYVGDGNDTVLTLPNLGHNMLIHGGAGNDHLVSGRGDDVLVGGGGNDVLIGGQGRDLLIGGRGADQLFASSGRDLLIAGYTAFDDHKQPLLSLSAEWSSNRNYNNRRENLLGTNQNSNQYNQRLNDNYFLVNSGEDQTVFGDEEQDYLVGGGGRDWYFADLASDNEEDENDYFLGLRNNERIEWTSP